MGVRVQVLSRLVVHGLRPHFLADPAEERETAEEETIKKGEEKEENREKEKTDKEVEYTKLPRSVEVRLSCLHGLFFALCISMLCININKQYGVSLTNCS